MDGVDPARRPQRVRELPPDLGNLGDRQERRHGENGEQRQHAGLERAGAGQLGAGNDHGEPAETGGYFLQHGLPRQIAEERQPERDGGTRLVGKRCASAALLLEGDDLAEALDGVHRMGVEIAQRLARSRAEAVDPASCDHRVEPREGEKRGQRRGHVPAIHQQRGQHRGRHQQGDERRRNGMGEEVLDHLNVEGGDRDEVAGAPAREIGRGQTVQFLEHVDAHLAQQPVGHIVRRP